MSKPKSGDFYVERLLTSADDLITALNHYTYPEAEAVLDWIRERLKAAAVIKKERQSLAKVAPDFPVRIPPKRRFIYSVPYVQKPKIPG